MKEFKINIFGRFLNLLEGDLNYNTEELNKFLDGYNFLVLNPNNINLAPPELAESKYYTTYVKTIDYIKNFMDNDFSQEEIYDLKRDVD